MEDINSLSNIINLVSLFAPKSEPKTSSGTGQRSMFPIDAHIHTEPLRVCKCLIPYLPFEKQREISILIKVFELVAINNYFSSLDVAGTTSLELNRGENWQKDLLLSIKDNLDPKNAYWIDVFFKMNDVKKLLANGTPSISPKEDVTKLSLGKAKPSQDFTENIAPNLTSEQKKMLEMLSSFTS